MRFALVIAAVAFALPAVADQAAFEKCLAGLNEVLKLKVASAEVMRTQFQHYSADPAFDEARVEGMKRVQSSLADYLNLIADRCQTLRPSR